MSDPHQPQPAHAEAVVQRGSLRVEGRDVAGQPPVAVQRWCEVALTALEAEGVPAGRVDLHFVGPQEMAELNQEHLGHQGPTDVLSFPYEDDPWAAPGPVGSGPGDGIVPGDGVVSGDVVVLGDVVVCAEVAARQAPDHAGRVDDELALLVVHGVLHVLGWDHAEDDEARAMQRREAEVLEQAGCAFPHPADR